MKLCLPRPSTICPTLLAAPSTLRPTFFNSLCRGILHTKDDCRGAWNLSALASASHRSNKYPMIQRVDFRANTADAMSFWHVVLQWKSWCRHKHRHYEIYDEIIGASWAESFSAMFTNRSVSSGDSPFAVWRLCVWNMGRAKRVSYKWNICKKWRRTPSLLELRLQAAIAVQQSRETSRADCKL